MTGNFLSCFAFIVGLLLSPTLNAELFKWIDDQGNVHYSDNKPNQDLTEATRLSIDTVTSEARDANGTHYARIHKPIANTSESSLSLELISVDFDRQRISGNGAVGRARSGKQCKYFRYHYMVNGNDMHELLNSLKVYFLQALRQYRYTLFKANEERSFLSFSKGADYSLKVTLDNIEINSCEKTYIAVRKHQLSSLFAATWTLFDNKTGDIAYQGQTKGYHSGLYFSREVRSKGVEDGTTKSIQNMVGNLFADKKFVTRLAN